MYRRAHSSLLLSKIHRLAIPSTSKADFSTITHNELRKSFLDYYKSKNHEVRPSSSVLPDISDGSLLFTNAGMNQFKSIILGSSTEPKRIVSVQKCIRAGGKHNDLDDVGSDLHHQTFFEMLGNWSFNDAYSKEEACKYAWSYLCDVLKIDSSRLYVSYFGGSDALGLPADAECREIWKKIGVPPSHILPFIEENFWEMGSSGPCGVCTEIHYDRHNSPRDASSLVNKDNSVVELWNIVFMSNLRHSSGDVTSLARAHIDTGMGFERLLSVVQNVNSNFDTDVFRPIFNKIEEVSGHVYKGQVGKEDEARRDAAFRIVADHLRAVSVAVADGATPAASDRGFVVRKMLRRSFLQSSRALDIERGAIGEIIDVVVDSLKEAYPELAKSRNAIRGIVATEETQFWKVVDKGGKTFDQLLRQIPKESTMFPGLSAFMLHDTHGLAVEITTELARQLGLKVDIAEFEKLRNEAKAISKKSSNFGVSVSSSEFPSHSDQAKYEYLYEKDGYVFPQVSSKVLAVFEDGHNLSDKVAMVSKGFVVLENCQFYAEEGGQKSDQGHLLINGEKVFFVESAKNHEGVTVLFGNICENGEGLLKKDVVVEQKIDETRRCGLMRAHSATHLLNWALRKVGLGAGQRGSSLDQDSLRFDYATVEESLDAEKRIKKLRQLESLICKRIEEANATFVKTVPIEEAKKIEQLQSEFREDKEYPSEVRVCGFGSELDGRSDVVECCSGTHVLNSSHIGDFVILADRSAAKGIRRIVAVTHDVARRSRRYAEDVVADLNDAEDEPKLKEKVAKAIDWDRLPCLDQHNISRIAKKEKKKKVNKK